MIKKNDYIALSIGCLACLLFPAESLAALFEILPTDKSKEYLGMLFGARISTLSLGGAPSPALSEVFEAINTIVVFLGVAVISYVGVSSTINTAYEGEALGKKLSTFWVPMRVALGMLLMIPTQGSGYSLIQALVMWIVLQGIGAANQVWNVVLDSVAAGFSTQGGVALSSESITVVNQQADTLLDNLLRSAVCIEGYQKLNQVASSSVTPSSAFYDDLVGSSGQAYSPSAFLTDEAFRIRLFPGKIEQPDVQAEKTSITQYYYAGIKGASSDKEAICGKYKITGIGDSENAPSGNGDDRRSAAQTDLFTMAIGLNSLYNLVNPTAKKIVSNPQVLDTNLVLQDTDPQVRSLNDTFKFAKQEYINILSGLAIVEEASESKKQQVLRHKQNGWIHAGGLYFFLGGTSSPAKLPDDTKSSPDPLSEVPSINTNSEVIPNSVLDPLDSRDGARVVMQKFLSYTTDLINLTGSVPAQAQSAISAGGASGGKLLGAVIKNMAKLDFAQFMADIGTNDPLLAIKEMGNSIMSTAEITWITLIPLSFITPLAGGPPGLSGFVYALETLTMVLISVLTGGLMLLWTTGATMAIYIPMIPYMMFTVSAMGWMIAVIEAMVAAPVFALSLTTPSGDELGKAASGLQILANVFLRPVLMIFGFILAARLLHAAITFVTFGIEDMLIKQTGNGAFWLFAFTVKLGLYTAVILSITNKCFALIFLLPNQILRWMGGQPETPVEAESILQEARGKFDGAAGSSQQAIQGAGGAAQKGMSARRQTRNVQQK